MPDLQYTVDIDTRGASTSINNLRRTIVGVGASLAAAFGTKEIVQIAARFEDLRTTLGFLFGDVKTGAAAFDQIKKFATESIFTVEDLTASVIKLKAAGLDPSIEQLKLFADVASVSADSVGALQAITDLFARTTGGGLGLEDLNRLADRGVPVFAILKDKLNLARLEVGKFGQTSEGAAIILEALTEGLRESFSGSSAARANNLSQAFSNLEDAIANTADAIGQAGLTQTIGDAVRSFTEFLEKNRAVILVISEGLIKALVFLGENLKYIGILMVGVFSAAAAGRIIAIVGAVVSFTKALRAAATAGAILQGVTGVGLVKLAAGLAGSAAAIATINKLSGDAQSSIDEVDKKLEEFKNKAEEPLSLPDAPTGGGTGNFEERLQNLKDKQEEVTKSAINYFQRYKDGVADMKLAIEQEEELLGMTESQANVQRELNRFTKEYFDTIRPLQEQLTQLKLKDTEASKTQAAEIEKQIGQITELYEASKAGLEDTLRAREKTREEQERALELEDALNKRIEYRRDLFDTLNDKIRESKNDLEKINMNPFEVQLKELNEAIDDDLIKAINKVKRQWEDGLITTDEYLAEIKVLEAEATKAFEVISSNAKKQREIQRSFEYGWRKAFESYEDDATNAAKAAERIFQKTTKGMEDTIVNFAKTGKFEFKSFVNSILEDLLRSQVQQIIARTFGTFGSGGGSNIFSQFGKFLGFANGGIIPTNSPVMVGEKGPELLLGASGNRVIPNSQLGMGGNVTYNINAVDAMSFKQMVAQDPGFIHAVAMQGGRATPGRR